MITRCEDQVRLDAQYRAALKVYSEAVQALKGLRGADLYKALERAHEAHIVVRAHVEELADRHECSSTALVKIWRACRSPGLPLSPVHKKSLLR